MDAKDFGNRLIARRWAQNEVADLKRLGAEYVARDDKRHEAIFVRRRQRSVIFQDTRTGHWTEYPYPQVNPRHWAYDLIQAALDR
ncbi:MAG TPA: hypothetical protein P5186_16170 [Candidatus Paceibacterota bacterium]|nr:hypothetical protein [Verrucomicrobiota bacterium]HRY49585.1 hypothetical protein [Candidatus Paceibacterota bacterium]